jgi:hypothetical protein
MCAEKDSHRPLQDELTAKMHSEFTVSKETEIQLRAGCVWHWFYFDYEKGDYKWTEEEIRKQAEKYGISYEECMMHKDYWMQIVLKNRDYYEHLKI